MALFWPESEKAINSAETSHMAVMAQPLSPLIKKSVSVVCGWVETNLRRLSVIFGSRHKVILLKRNMSAESRSCPSSSGAFRMEP